ncbi:mucin-12 [Sinocyclocheilus grahami]|uniref:Mucin-12-like n=1 Tax=Sinocyclocheilus grahami TaxID=75366 RepID=A0A672LAL9_SINGR|nr:PREDICTED: mucin-12-like [Sinocyclocheilus grahami]
MLRFVYLFLLIFAPGNTLLNLNQECGGKIIGERSGSIRYSLHPNSLLFNRITSDNAEKLLDVICTWIIDAYENQTVWIEVISVGKGARVGIKFGNGNTLIYEREERALFSGIGRTIIEWSLRRTDETFATLHLRWNTSEDSHTLALIPYTHSVADPVSPFPNGSNDVTYTPNISVSSNAAHKTHTLMGESMQQGGGVSDLDDKRRPLFPQEITNNGQETAGAWISDLALAGTHSYSDTQSSSALDTHMNTHTMLSNEPSLMQSSTEIQSPLVSVQTTPKQATDVAKTSALLTTNDVAHTELHIGSSQHTHTHSFTKIQPKTTKRDNPSSMFPTSSFMTVSPHYIQPFNKTSKHFLSGSSYKSKATTVTLPNRDGFTISENAGKSRFDSIFWSSNTITDDNQHISSEMDRTDRSPRSTNADKNITNQRIYDDSVLTTSTPATVSEFPDVNQTHTLAFSFSDTAEYSTSPNELPINVTTENEPTTSGEFMHSSYNTLETPTLMSLEASTTLISHTIQSQHDTSTQGTSSASASISYRMSHNTNKISAFTTFPDTILPDLTPTESPSTPKRDKDLSPSESDCLGLACTLYLVSTVQGKQESPVTSPPSISLSSPQISRNVTSDLMVEDSTTVRSENRTDLEELDVSPSQVQNTNTKSSMHTEFPIYTFTPQYSTSSENTKSNVGFSDVTDISEKSSGQTVSDPTQTRTTISKTTLGSSLFNDIHTGSTENTNGLTARTIATLSTSSLETTTPYISQVSTTVPTSTSVSTTTPHWETSETSVVHTPSITSPQMNPHATSTETTSVQVQTHIPVRKPSTVRLPQHMTTSSYLIKTKAHTVSKQVVTQTSWIHSTASSFDRKWLHGRHYFIVKDQPAIIKEKTFQVLLQIVLEGDYAPSMRLLEVETFLYSLSGFQNQHVTWHSGPVLQTLVQFQTVEALSWLGRVESLLQEAGLNPLPKKGILVGGVRVKNITVGGLQTDVCEWLFECPSGFQCVSSKGNATCTSVCHSEYCKHQGICVHRLGQQPICQCPVGEDYWFMGQRCDLRMTRPRLVGVCFGVLVAVAAIMALLSYLTVRRFKTMIMQAKVEQTRSSYRRFNHFDELSARFWGRSWPGSEDSLDNPAFTRSDELLHMRALDRTCCYHDDTLSVVSTYHGSGTHLNTIYPHGSQYGWDLSNCSLADGVMDSGKASDLSVCSWPIEPIQWTPFPLLQQINRNTTTVKASRPRSYCEGMELVDLEKSWTA